MEFIRWCWRWCHDEEIVYRDYCYNCSFFVVDAHQAWFIFIPHWQVSLKISQKSIYVVICPGLVAILIFHQYTYHVPMFMYSTSSRHFWYVHRLLIYIIFIEKWSMYVEMFDLPSMFDAVRDDHYCHTPVGRIASSTGVSNLIVPLSSKLSSSLSILLAHSDLSRYLGAYWRVAGAFGVVIIACGIGCWTFLFGLAAIADASSLSPFYFFSPLMSICFFSVGFFCSFSSVSLNAPLLTTRSNTTVGNMREIRVEVYRPVPSDIPVGKLSKYVCVTIPS